jgi:peptidoglycan/LPS O-acetylase OafA/YrhL
MSTLKITNDCIDLELTLLTNGPSEKDMVILPAAVTSISPPNYKYLDGLRGICCLSVILYHLDFVQRTKIESWYYMTPLMLTNQGGSCVFIFFVISGFVLPLGQFKKPAMHRIQSASFRRFARLMIPMFAMFAIKYLCHCFDQRPTIDA